LGLHSEESMTLKGVEEAKTADSVFAEFYTSLMPELNFSVLEKLVGKRITILSRKDLEDDCAKKVLEATEKGKAVLLVPGDPLIATAHVDLRIRAKRQGVNARIVHGVSVISAVIGLSGLHNYKFGRSVTVPFTDGDVVADTAYNVIEENRQRGLHTLCFLDLKAEEKRCMTVNEGLQALLKVEQQKRKGVVTSNTIAVGIAQAGSHSPVVKADRVKALLKSDFGSPPHTIVFPGKLHFMEAEALIVLAGAPDDIKELVE
jgi:diphthine synthase